MCWPEVEYGSDIQFPFFTSSFLQPRFSGLGSGQSLWSKWCSGEPIIFFKEVVVEFSVTSTMHGTLLGVISVFAFGALNFANAMESKASSLITVPVIF